MVKKSFKHIGTHWNTFAGGSTATLSSSISSNSLAAAHPGAGAHFHHTSSKAALGGAASGAPGSVICVADTPDVTLPLMSKAGGALLPGAATIVHRESREGSRDQSAGGMGMKGDLSVVVTVSNSNVQLGGHGGAAGGMLPVSSAPGRLDGVEVPWHGGPPADERQDLHSHGGWVMGIPGWAVAVQVLLQICCAAKQCAQNSVCQHQTPLSRQVTLQTGSQQAWICMGPPAYSSGHCCAQLSFA
jgi:hypothetical protein